MIAPLPKLDDAIEALESGASLIESEYTPMHLFHGWKENHAALLALVDNLPALYAAHAAQHPPTTSNEPSKEDRP